MLPPRILPEDLAPGDARARELDWSRLRVERVDGPAHPLFQRAYDRLWREFGAKGEMERADVIAARLAWDPRRPLHGHALLYELLAVHDGAEIVGLRDHTAVVPPRPGAPVLVHLSHVLVEPALRGGGLSGWLRALPLQAARACAALTGRACAAITLVGEMEHPDAGAPDVTARIRSYARAGFLKIDPAAVDYAQPDFRPAAEIDATGVRPVPLMLIVRRVGAEAETSMPGVEVRELVTALYTLFGAFARPADMAPLWARAAALPPDDARVRLVPLTA